MSQGEQSRAGPGQKRGDKRRERPLPLVLLPPRAERRTGAASPDRSEDVLFCFPSALPLPAGSNITLGTKALAALATQCAIHRCNGTIMYRYTDVQQVKSPLMFHIKTDFFKFLKNL